MLRTCLRWLFSFSLLSNPFSHGPLKQQRSRAQSSQTLSVSDWTLFGNWQSVQRNRLGIEHPGKFHFTSEVVYLWKIIWFGVSKQRGLHRSQWLMCESRGLQTIRKSWSCLAKWIQLLPLDFLSFVCAIPACVKETRCCVNVPFVWWCKFKGGVGRHSRIPLLFRLRRNSKHKENCCLQTCLMFSLNAV